jgi:SAM-dependent methyltransferase
VVSFESVVDEYEQGRPTYPAGVYDALGSIEGLRVLEGGAGTGIATRELLRRGARVVPFDVGPDILGRAVRRSPGLAAVVADGARLPFRDGCADLTCFAQSWHWLDPDRRCQEAARVLAPRGRWAGWWSHARADGQPWFESYWSALESASVARKEHREIDWGDGLARSGVFHVEDRVTVPWVREVSVDHWLTDQASHSYVAALDTAARGALMVELRHIVTDAFPTGAMDVPYETWLWIARPLH